MEQTLHGCDGCADDRVVADKLTYHFSSPSPGDVVIFRSPPAWQDVGGADLIERVVAVGGQTVACCDTTNRVLVDGRPITEAYLYYQPGLGTKQATFDPVRVPDGQLWVMGDNRNNSADARFHGPVPVSDVIGNVRVVVLPISRWRTVPAINPQY
jgi:signal peptidase I